MIKRIDGWQQTDIHLSLEKIDKVAACTIIWTFTWTLSWMLRMFCVVGARSPKRFFTRITSMADRSQASKLVLAQNMRATAKSVLNDSQRTIASMAYK